MHTSEYRVLGVCLLALTTIGLCGRVAQPIEA